MTRPRFGLLGSVLSAAVLAILPVRADPATTSTGVNVVVIDADPAPSASPTATATPTADLATTASSLRIAAAAQSIPTPTLTAPPGCRYFSGSLVCSQTEGGDCAINARAPQHGLLVLAILAFLRWRKLRQEPAYSLWRIALSHIADRGSPIASDHTR